MKIVIIAPSPVPFGVGGAEKLWWGMQEYINKNTTNQCELIKIPTKENSFWDLIESYYKFYKLDLSHFDMVISTKYPAWMIQHQNHHVYLQHCLRGLYDTYHFSQKPLIVESEHKKVNEIIYYLENKDTTIDTVFTLLFELQKDASVPQDTYDFPGPFIRQIIHFLDNKTMQNVESFQAISQTVINRKEYFPKGSIVEKNFHPSNLSNLHNESYDYFFTASRLDTAKRIEMIISAYKKSSTTIPLKVAGAGPLTKQMKELVKDDNRIEMLGFISDEELILHYSKAYAVLFVPYDEDYGLITIEAAMSEKPVLTFDDAGGVVEFIENEKTGLVCKPDVNELSKNIDYISENTELCKTMGQNAKKAVENITWKNTIENLLKNSKKKLKLTVATTYPVYPPRGGGQNRVFYLYKELAKTMVVDIVCIVNADQEYTKVKIAKNLYEIRVPKSYLHQEKEDEMREKAGIPVTDIAMLYLADETPAYKDAIASSYENSNFLIATQVYTYGICRSITNDAIIHDSQNVEYNLKKQMLQDTPYNRELLETVFIAEKEAANNSIFTTVCANEDALTMEKIYGFNPKKSLLVANGVDLHTVNFMSKVQRDSMKTKLGLDNQKLVLFIGSWHQPNIDAVDEIFILANKLPEYKFLIMGTVANYFKSENKMHLKPENVGFTGMLNDLEKEYVLSTVDIAINPMLTGSGTNLKMLDYMANGIPVLSTKIGARGLSIPEGYIAVADICDFDKYIKDIHKFTNIEKSRSYVEENFSWNKIKESLENKLFSVDNNL
ncbi:glycosyltransferase [Poseidonibacter lekithochrous]|uniref:glycosyltransferase n=1 Tax=Poseidonibacter TaxID=2321187 RepID=UPI001C09C3CA|nr:MULTISPECIES: glycosyltransferase [Poseidonibacter]MBU3014242.1 glycosyltransferase [Poseidonibacter lekithochrous]MDO6827539.1 glycosyltransferase [Poseidonibacter sp. 1_MG-2023]